MSLYPPVKDVYKRQVCASAKRDRSVICVVETPRDVQAFERTREYHGLYHAVSYTHLFRLVC